MQKQKRKVQAPLDVVAGQALRPGYAQQSANGWEPALPQLHDSRHCQANHQCRDLSVFLQE